MEEEHGENGLQSGTKKRVWALEQGDYVELRRHEHPERYLESFARCREQIEELMAQEKEKTEGLESPLTAEKEKDTGQMSLFQMGLAR